MNGHLNRLPTFLVIGTNKAGTTTVHGALKAHPLVFLPYRKELHFFNDDLNYAKGVDWYVKSFFEDAAGFPARGDVTPTYLYWGDKVIPRIKAVYGDRPPRMVAILRDPVERAYSRYWHQRRVPGREPLSFEDALAVEPERVAEDSRSYGVRGRFPRAYFRGGLFGDQIERYFTSFPRDLFHVMLFHDLTRAFDATVRALFRFLDLDDAVEIRPIHRNPAAVLRAPGAYTWLRSRARVGRLATRVLSPRMLSRLRKALRRPFLKPAPYPPIDPRTEAELRRRYLPDVRKLEQLIGRDLSCWYPADASTTACGADAGSAPG